MLGFTLRTEGLPGPHKANLGLGWHVRKSPSRGSGQCTAAAVCLSWMPQGTGHAGNGHMRPSADFLWASEGLACMTAFFQPLHSFLMCVAAQLLAELQRACKAQLPVLRLERELQSTFLHRCVDSFHNSLTKLILREQRCLT